LAQQILSFLEIPVGSIVPLRSDRVCVIVTEIVRGGSDIEMEGRKMVWKIQETRTGEKVDHGKGKGEVQISANVVGKRICPGSSVKIGFWTLTEGSKRHFRM
jgi:hypothetical protein